MPTPLIRAAWILTQQIIYDGASPFVVLPESKAFNTRLDDFYKAMGALDQKDPAANAFKDLIYKDVHQTVNSRSDDAVFAIGVPTVLGKLAAHADTVLKKLPDDSSAQMIAEEANGLQDLFANLDGSTQQFIEADIRSTGKTPPMQIMVDFVIDEANAAYDAQVKAAVQDVHTNAKTKASNSGSKHRPKHGR